MVGEPLQDEAIESRLDGGQLRSNLDRDVRWRRPGGIIRAVCRAAVSVISGFVRHGKSPLLVRQSLQGRGTTRHLPARLSVARSHMRLRICPVIQ